MSKKNAAVAALQFYLTCVLAGESQPRFKSHPSAHLGLIENWRAGHLDCNAPCHGMLALSLELGLTHMNGPSGTIHSLEETWRNRTGKQYKPRLFYIVVTNFNMIGSVVEVPQQSH